MSGRPLGHFAVQPDLRVPGGDRTDPGPAGTRQQLGRTPFVAETPRAAVRHRFGVVDTMIIEHWSGQFERGGEQSRLRQQTPDGDHQPATRAAPGGQLPERSHRVVEEHHAEPRDHHVHRIKVVRLLSVADQPFDPNEHQLWCKRVVDGPWTLEILVEDIRDGVLHFRRDLSVTMPLEEAFRVTPEGIPYVAPHLQLLYKTKGRRPRDDADFVAAVPMLSEEEIVWLDEHTP